MNVVRRPLLLAIAVVVAALTGCGVLVAVSWHEAKTIENDQLGCRMQRHKHRADGPLEVRETPRGKVCVYTNIAGKPVQTLPLDAP